MSDLVKTENVRALLSIKDALQAQRERFARVLQKKGIDPDEFILGITSAIHATPKLAACTKDSVLLAAYKAAVLGLRLGDATGQAYLIPRDRKTGDGKWVKEATFQVGYQGVLEHIYRSKDIKSVFAQVVRESDRWEPPRFTEAGVKFTHEPNWEADERGPIVAAWARVRLTRDDEPLVFALSIQQIYDKHRANSKAYDENDPSCPWVKYEEQMVLKTMYIIAGKYAPKSIHEAEILSVAEKSDQGFDVPIREAEDSQIIVDVPAVTPASVRAGEVMGVDDSRPEPHPTLPQTAALLKAVEAKKPTSIDRLVASGTLKPASQVPSPAKTFDSKVARSVPPEDKAADELFS